MKHQILVLTALFCCVLGFAKEPKRPTSYNYQRGCELIRNNQLDEGIEFLENELNENPKNGYAATWLAAAMAQKDEFGSAISFIELALKNVPKNDREALAWAHSLKGRLAEQLKDTTMALNEYSIAIKLEPNNEDRYEDRGKLYRQLKQWDKSDADFEKYISLMPGLIHGYLLLGRNFFLRECYTEALAKYSYANQLAQRSWALSAMAECEIKLGMYEEAADHIVEALKLEPYESLSLNLLQSCKNVEFADLMKAKFQVQIAKNPNSPEWLSYTIVLERGQKRYENAIRICHKVLIIYPDAGYYDLIAENYCKMGDWEHALQYENEALAADSTDVEYLFARSQIYDEMDSTDAMYADLNRIVEENVDNASVYFARGNARFFHRDYEQAIEDFNMGLAIESSDDWNRYMRGRCYEAIGNLEKAQKDFLRVEKSSSADYKMFALASLGKKEEALALADSLLKADTIEHTYRYNVACVYALVGEKELAMRYIEEDLKDGNVEFNHLRHDPDLQSLSGDDLERLIQKYETISDERIANFQAEQGEPVREEKVVEVPFTAANGVTKVDCTINGLSLNFVFDTGASDVTISQTEANFMYKNGYLSQKDVIGKQLYQTADGNISVGTTFMINHINFGGLELSGVRASVVANQKAPLLLGQTVLQRLGKIEIDNERKVLRITTRK